MAAIREDIATESLSLQLNEFAFKLYNHLSAGKSENFFISPYSISTALSMCLSGAAGETAAELKKVLALDSLTDAQILKLNGALINSINSENSSVTLNTANRIYPNQGYEIKKQFTDNLNTYFHSDIEQVDYSKAQESADKINSWVAEKTKEKIQNLVPAAALTPLTRLVLVNAIYFKGNWLNKFDSKLTAKEDFHLKDGSKKQVDMMQLTTKKFRYQDGFTDGLNASVCEFPYVGQSVAMTIILPAEGIDIDDVEKKLSHSRLQELLEAPVRNNKVFAYIPKFKLEHEAELSDALKALGAPLAFNQAKADFSGINDNGQGLYISKVVHKAVVEVNEEGTEAAAATGVIMMTRAAIVEPPPVEFRCNRPFIFVIHEKQSNTVLFMGKYHNPQ